MPAPNPPHASRLTCNNGLALTVRHEPRLKHSAAYLRVAAGSHDVPAAWPGLAHFLEHLLFLGTDRFPPAQGLMAYVQQQGGHINARTSERHTDFFFELPPAAFEGGLERLCDMLAHPRMNTADQLREREVLHAEFIAWVREPSTQHERRLFQPLNPAHPLRAFHAGNRYSLPVPRAAFQQALKDFHEQYYQTGQMTLTLVGPQSLEELITLAERHSAPLTRGEPVRQCSPPPLLVTGKQRYQHVDGRRLNLMLAMERLPVASDQALAFLCHWINADKPGGLAAQLRQLHLIDTLNASVVYPFDGQALLNIALTTPADSAPQTQQIIDAFDGWLAFFSAKQPWPALREEYRLLHQRQQQVSSALALARIEGQQCASHLSDQGVQALRAILTQIQPVAPTTCQHDWQLPTPNPFLTSEKEPVNAGLIRGQTSAHRGLRTFAQDRLRSRRDRSAMTFSAAMPTDSDEAALRLRWHFATAHEPTFLSQVQHSLQTLKQDAHHAGVELSLNAQGNDWLLNMRGVQEPMPTILEHVLRSLDAPVQHQAQGSPEAPLMPIRHLLKRLPERCQAQALPAINDLQQGWASARWDGLAVGLATRTQTLITAVLNKAPGIPDTDLSPAAAPMRTRQWHTEPCASSEHAVLLFCPAPTADIADEAAWRLLAHLAQQPFYQRLRVELQLGYAVFSGLRQFNGRTGLLFGVQSPHAATTEIFEQIRQFIEQLSTLVSTLDETSFIQARASLAQQFSTEALSMADARDLLWHAKQAGHSSDYLKALYTALMALEPSTTLNAAQRINQPNCDWLCLATSSETETFNRGRS